MCLHSEFMKNINKISAFCKILPAVLVSQLAVAGVDYSAKQNHSSFSAPDLVAGASFYDNHRNKQIAAWSLQQVRKSLPVIDDGYASQVLSQMGALMNAQVRSVPLFETLLLQDENINAFAVPGGFIAMNSGVVMTARDMDEVASVMAHEIAHISQRHYEHRLDNQKKLLAMQLGGLAAVIAASAAGEGNAAVAALAGTQTASAESMATHSREHEREADRIGMQILVRSGFDARAMPRFFARLQQSLSINQSKNAFMPSFMQSHPFTAERLSEATARAQSHTPPVMSARQATEAQFDKWLWRLQLLSGKSNEAKFSANISHSVGARLAFAWFLADKQRVDEAAGLLNHPAIDHTDPLTCLTRAHIFAVQQDFMQAAQAVQACQVLYPERRDLRLALASYQVHTGEALSALVLLADFIRDGSHDVAAWQIARGAFAAQAKSADTPRAKALAQINTLRADAQLALWRADYTQSLQMLAQAKKQASEDATKNALLIAALEKDIETVRVFRDFKP